MTRFDSFLIATDRPGEVADWYAALLDGVRENDNVVHVGDIKILLFPHEAIAGENPQPERIMLNFAIDDAEQFAAHADELGVKWQRRFEPEPFGLLATVVDPVGNFVQFAQHTAVAEEVA